MIDLKARFGKEYRIFHDPSWVCETSANRSEFKAAGEEAWYYELRGPNVTISPCTQDTVVALWHGAGSKALKAVAIATRRLHGERVYIIPGKALAAILARVRIYRKRQATEASRARGRELAVRYGFKKAH